MTEEEKKLQAKADKQDRRIQKLVTEKQDQEKKITEQDQRIGQLEREKQERDKIQKRIRGQVDKLAGSHRIDQMIQDGGGDTLAHVLNVGEQALLDYLIESFPDSVGQHRVALKTVPPALALLWYLYEIITMKKQTSLGKRVRIQAANVLGNLGFVYLAQTYWRDRGDHKQANRQLAQENVALDAKNQKLQDELMAITQRLKDAGLAP